eukprot:2514315-Amphidinium_carterae.1
MEPIMAKLPADPLKVGSTVDGLSPRRLDDVLVDDKEAHAAQLAASQFSDGTTPAPVPLLPQLHNNAK